VRSTRLLSSIERALGFDPLPVPPHVFSLGPQHLAYGSFDRRGDGFALRALHRVELPPGAFQRGLLGGPPKDPGVLEQALGDLRGRLPGTVREASLVVPDGWLRVSFGEGGDLPDGPRARDEVLRFKLRRLVPFRVEELRVGAVELPSQDASTPRLVLAFALETVLAQLEGVFERAGIHVGQVVSASLALLAALEPPEGEVLAVALVETEGYTLAFAHGAELLLHRYKAAGEGVESGVRAGLVRRDLLLTRNFLEEQLARTRIDRAFLVAPPDLETGWLNLLEDGLGLPVVPLRASHLPFSGSEAAFGTPLPLTLVAPMLGAATREVP
jgi:hypothetical protein